MFEVSLIVNILLLVLTVAHFAGRSQMKRVLAQKEEALARMEECNDANFKQVREQDLELGRMGSLARILQWCRLHEGEMNRWSSKLPPEVADVWKCFAVPKGNEAIGVLDGMHMAIVECNRCLNNYRELWEKEERAEQARVARLMAERAELLRFFLRRAFVAPQWVYHLRWDNGIKGNKSAEAAVGRVQDMLTAQALEKLGELIRLERDIGGMRVWTWDVFVSTVRLDTDRNRPLRIIEELQDHRPNGPDSYGSGVGRLPNDLELTLHREMRSRTTPPVA